MRYETYELGEQNGGAQALLEDCPIFRDLRPSQPVADLVPPFIPQTMCPELFFPSLFGNEDQNRLMDFPAGKTKTQGEQRLYQALLGDLPIPQYLVPTLR